MTVRKHYKNLKKNTIAKETATNQSKWRKEIKPRNKQWKNLLTYNKSRKQKSNRVVSMQYSIYVSGIISWEFVFMALWYILSYPFTIATFESLTICALFYEDSCFQCSNVFLCSVVTHIPNTCATKCYLVFENVFIGVLDLHICISICIRSHTYA